MTANAMVEPSRDTAAGVASDEENVRVQFIPKSVDTQTPRSAESAKLFVAITYLPLPDVLIAGHVPDGAVIVLVHEVPPFDETKTPTASRAANTLAPSDDVATPVHEPPSSKTPSNSGVTFVHVVPPSIDFLTEPSVPVVFFDVAYMMLPLCDNATPVHSSVPAAVAEPHVAPASLEIRMVVYEEPEANPIPATTFPFPDVATWGQFANVGDDMSSDHEAPPSVVFQIRLWPTVGPARRCCDEYAMRPSSDIAIEYQLPVLPSTSVQV